MAEKVPCRTWKQFYWRWTKTALSHPWSVADTCATIFGLILPPSISFRPHLEQTLTPLAWKIPLSALALLGAARLILAPYWIYRERHEDAEAETEDLKRRLSEIENAKPNIVLREPQARHVQEVTFYGANGLRNLQFVKVRFINQKKEDAVIADATGIRAKIEFFNDSARLLLRMDGRWDSSKHPSKLGPGENFNDLLRMNFGAEEEQNVDVVFWNPIGHQFVAFNNDSYQLPDLTKPDYVLGRGPITAKIRLVNSRFDRVFNLNFCLGSDGRIVILD